MLYVLCLMGGIILGAILVYAFCVGMIVKGLL